MVLLQTVPTHINVQEIKQKLLSQFGHMVADVHEFHVWRLSGNKIVATAHIRCRGNLDDYMRLAEKMKEFFHDEGIHSTTIQPELMQVIDEKGNYRIRPPSNKSLSDAPLNAKRDRIIRMFSNPLNKVSLCFGK
jgi:solute carrier family 30 (zinc transporter), member 1